MQLRKLVIAEVGEERLLEILRAKKVPAELIPDVVASVSGAWRGNIREEASSYLAADQKDKNTQPAPTMQELLALKPNVQEGARIERT